MKGLNVRLLLSFLLFLSVQAICWSQVAPVIWGEVDSHAFEKTVVNDTGVGAVILCDYATQGYEDLRGALRVVFFRHVRIKVLNFQGLVYANVRIPYRAGGSETVFDIRAQTINKVPSGELERTEMPRTAILEEKVNDELIAVLFSLPGVKENSVLEYTYKIASSDLYNFRPWQFQRSLPVLWSEFRAEIQGVYNYMAVLHNVTEPLEVNEKKDTLLEIPVYLLGIQSGRDHLKLKVTNGRWVLRNVPRLKSEPFVSAPADYVKEIRFQLYSVTVPGSKPLAIVQKWDDVARTLGSDSWLGMQLVPDRNYRQALRKVDQFTGNGSRAEKIYQWFVSSHSWNGKESIRSSRNVAELGETGTGNAADLNLFLVNLYRAAGYNAYPALISTRSNGKIQKEVPLISQFNRTLCLLEAEGQKILLDATGALVPFGQLPLQDYNGSALVLHEKNIEWYAIPAEKMAVSNSTLTFRFEEDGILNGFLVCRESGGKALESLNRLKEDGQEEFIQNQLNKISFGLELDSFRIWQEPGIKDSLAFELSFSSVEWRHQFENMELIYFDSFMPGDFRENPFRDDSRTLPVDFAYPVEMIQNVIIEIPEGYTVEEVPTPEFYNLDREKMDYRFNIAHNEEVVQLQTRLRIGQISYPASDYNEIRSLFSLLASKYGEHIVASKDKD